MRIISGKFKGKSIDYLKSKITRPLKDTVKENIFNILSHSNLIRDINIKRSNVLDLYSGVGSFGLECISRGANQVTFIEEDINAIKVLKSNLKKLSSADNAKVVNDKIENFLKNIKINEYNICFCDPPFTDKMFIENLKYLKENKVFSSKHVLIIHREKNSKDDLTNYFNTLIIRIYGRSKILFGTLK